MLLLVPKLRLGSLPVGRVRRMLRLVRELRLLPSGLLVIGMATLRRVIRPIVVVVPAVRVVIAAILIVISAMLVVLNRVSTSYGLRIVVSCMLWIVVAVALLLGIPASRMRGVVVARPLLAMAILVGAFRARTGIATGLLLSYMSLWRRFFHDLLAGNDFEGHCHCIGCDARALCQSFPYGRLEGRADQLGLEEFPVHLLQLEGRRDYILLRRSAF